MTNSAEFLQPRAACEGAIFASLAVSVKLGSDFLKLFDAQKSAPMLELSVSGDTLGIQPAETDSGKLCPANCAEHSKPLGQGGFCN
jgi:hypothetical protein